MTYQIVTLVTRFAINDKSDYVTSSSRDPPSIFLLLNISTEFPSDQSSADHDLFSISIIVSISFNSMQDNFSRSLIHFLITVSKESVQTLTEQKSRVRLKFAYSYTIFQCMSALSNHVSFRSKVIKCS